jgi:hypothetical protein
VEIQIYIYTPNASVHKATGVSSGMHFETEFNN